MKNKLTKLLKTVTIAALLLSISVALFGCNNRTSDGLQLNPVKNEEFFDMDSKYGSLGEYKENACCYTDFFYNNDKKFTKDVSDMKFTSAFMMVNIRKFGDLYLNNFSFKIKSDADVDLIIKSTYAAAENSGKIEMNCSLKANEEQTIVVEFKDRVFLDKKFSEERCYFYMCFESKFTERTADFRKWAKTKYTMSDFKFYCSK